MTRVSIRYNGESIPNYDAYSKKCRHALKRIVGGGGFEKIWRRLEASDSKVPIVSASIKGLEMRRSVIV